MMDFKKPVTAALIASGLLCGSAAQAAYTSPYTPPPTVDLSEAAGNDGGSIYDGVHDVDVYFAWDTTQPAGSGVINSFVQIQYNSPSDSSNSPKLRDPAHEQGYNTSVNNTPFDIKNGLNKDILIADLSPEDGYFQFLLDINEEAVEPDNFLSLDGLRLYAATGPKKSDETMDALGNWDPDEATVGLELLYDMDADADNWILLDYNRSGSGSGEFDMRMYVPDTIFDGVDTAEYPNFILWSRFGLNANPGLDSQAGFEEWAQLSTPGDGRVPPSGGVPSPAPLALLGLGIGLLGWRNYKNCY